MSTRYSLIDADRYCRLIAADRRRRASLPSNLGWDEFNRMPSQRVGEHSINLMVLTRGVCASALGVMDAYYMGWVGGRSGVFGAMGSGVIEMVEVLPGVYSSWPAYEAATGDAKHRYVTKTAEQVCKQPSASAVALALSCEPEDVTRLLRHARMTVCDNLIAWGTRA